MNSPELVDFEKEQPKTNEMVISGKAAEEAVVGLQSLYPDYELAGKSLKDLEDAEWKLIRQSELTLNRDEAKRLLATADAIRRVMVLTRPNNSIGEIVKDDQGRVLGLKINLKELENPGVNQAEDLPKAA